MAVIDTPGVGWVTGASKGIGRALSFELCARGWIVIASARNAEALAAVAAAARGPGRIVPAPLDITDPEAARAVVAAAVSSFGPIDLAILNAGMHIPTRIVDFNRDEVAKVVDTNFMGTMNCFAAVLPGLLARGRGEIAVMASMTGYAGLPTAAAYGATKAALISFSESVRPELERHGISMRLVSPGFVDTPLTRRNRFPMPFLISPEKAAQLIIKGLRKRRFEIAPPRAMAFFTKLLRLMPYPLFFAVTRRITPRDDKEVQAPTERT